MTIRQKITLSRDSSDGQNKLRILYVALKESVPGTHGGSVHVLEVLRNLVRRGHEMHVVVQRRSNQDEREQLDGAQIYRLAAPSNFLLWTLTAPVERIARTVQPDVVMERYYNFSGVGLTVAQKLKLGTLLEVNAPMIDPPGSRKALVDGLTFRALSRYARWQARATARIVTPLAVTVPPEVPRAKIREIPWGANVELFNPAQVDRVRVESLRTELGLSGMKVVAFLGSFRAWHGVREFAAVSERILRTRDDTAFLFIGSGELFDEIRARLRGNSRIILTGAVPYDDVPQYLALADIGAAPFNTSAHPPLRAGFYWSPLKVHEYMAMQLPVVTIDVPGLNQIVRHEQEGLLYKEGDAGAMDAAILRLLDDPPLAKRLGANARARVVAEYSWARHAERLEQALQECVSE